jgi:hypothetical protein
VVASQIRSLSTRDGNALLFNLHIASTTHRPEMFPDSESRLPDANAKVLFGMSSLIPPSLATRAAERGFKITHSSRFFGYNADLVSLAHFMQLGSSAAQQR